MKLANVRKLVVCAMLAALYTAVSLALAPLSFGIVQIRFAEAFTLLATLSTVGIFGVTLGCLLTNLVGVLIGTTLAPDVLFGTLATFIAALLSYQLRHVRVKGLALPSALPPILVNAVVIGIELTWFYSDGVHLSILLVNMLSVGLGQIIPCAVLGVLLIYTLERSRLDERLFKQFA
ncbi:MAG: QueT transporter family protein [Anaerotruncus sp.]|nr:QueT transporter family protein [Anaerotruncus sp.]